MCCLGDNAIKQQLSFPLRFQIKQALLFKISGSHGGEYEDESLLVYSAV
jgi:hypothetical protein